MPWWSTVRALRHSDAVVFGGGTLLTDVESVRACILWGMHVLACRLFGIPYMLAFQGIGPFRTVVGRAIARSVVRHARFISVRDNASAKRMASWSLHTEVIQTFDPVFALLYEQKHEERTKNVNIIIPRANSPASFLHRAVQLAAERSDEPVRALLFQPDDPSEKAIAVSLQAAISRLQIMPVRTVEELHTGLTDGHFVLTQRYHGAIAALACGVPFETVAQGEGDKLAAVAALQRDRPQDLGALVQIGEEALRQALKG